MFDDVHLPKSLGFKSRIKNMFQFEENTNTDVVLAVLLPTLLPDVEIPSVLGALDTGFSFDDAVGEEKPVDTMQPRSKTFRQEYTKVINRHIKTNIDDPDPCEGYLYFGNQDYTKILPMLCQVNPFFASALTVSGDNDEYLELNAYSELPASDSDARYLQIMRTMIPNPSRRINARFNKDMTLNQITSYESGEAVIIPEEDWNYYASGITYNVGYFANVQHSLIHVYHYYMTAAINYSTKHDNSLAAWANPYDDNIAIKYMEVVATLYKSSLGDDDGKAHTGKNGFGGTTEVMKELRDYLCIWGNCKNEDDFTKNFLLKDLYATAKNPEEVIKTSGILIELRKHMDNIEPFATELTDAMKANDEKSFKKAEETLTSFMSDCGEGLSSIDSISSWVQSMSCTGIIHGSTLGYSRMGLMPEIIRWRDIKAPTFDESDVALMTNAAPGIHGMTEDRHVFTNAIEHGTTWDTSPISSEVKAVLDMYSSKAEELKTKYENEIEKRDEFREFGWILTDHCTDGYDGKQHSISTYF